MEKFQSAGVHGIIPDEKREKAVINADVAGCSHFAGRVGSAAEIDKIAVMRRGIFSVLGFIIFAVKLFIHIIFRGGFRELLWKDSGKPKEKKRKTYNADN